MEMEFRDFTAAVTRNPYWRIFSSPSNLSHAEWFGYAGVADYRYYDDGTISPEATGAEVGEGETGRRGDGETLVGLLLSGASMWKLSLLAITIGVGSLLIASMSLAQFRAFGSEGTIIGRVFVDKNGDGEKQSGEPGIANAVIFSDDGLRVVTDEYGRFTIPSVHPGYRSAALDLSSIPGYQIAANLKLAERNSVSRMVRVAPGSLARMNFAVTPITRDRVRKRIRVAKIENLDKKDITIK